MHKINPLDTKELVSHIFDGHKETLNLFQADFSAPVLSICEQLREAYAGYLRFEKHPQPDEQFMYLTAHVFSLVESLYTSTKLLAHGFLTPSGNQFRVALECTALAVLLSWRKDMSLPKKRDKWTERPFFADFKDGKPWARSHRVIMILGENRKRLGLSEPAHKLLDASKKLYDNYSHVSFLSLRASIVNPDNVVFGGGYVSEQRDLFAKELDIRRQFTELMPQFVTTLYERAVQNLHSDR